MKALRNTLAALALALVPATASLADGADDCYRATPGDPAVEELATDPAATDS